MTREEFIIDCEQHIRKLEAKLTDDKTHSMIKNIINEMIFNYRRQINLAKQQIYDRDIWNRC